jgi:putative membrane protein
LGDRFHRYRGEKLSWWQVISRIIGTVIPHILPWVLLCGASGLLISLFDHFGLLSSVKGIKALPQIVISLNVVLSLLLVFRTNTAHDHFWEGRKLWGAMVNRARNLSRGIWLYIEERESRDRMEKEKAMRLVAAFPIAMKLHLRREAMNSELEPLLSPPQYERILQASHGPLEIAFWIGDYLQYQHERQYLNVFQLIDLQKMVDDIVDILGACERILKTPVPLIYTIALKTLLIAYFLIVPLGLVESLGWETGPAMAFVGLMFLTINEVGSEIEEPFGPDPNDLPLDFICQTIERNIEDLISHAPSSRQFGCRPRKAA